MLRSDLETALNDLEVACEEAADGHDDAADLLDAMEVSATLADLSQRRHAQAKRLRDLIREVGDLPRDPDPDHETLLAGVRHLKAAFSADEAAAVLSDRAEAEESLAELVDEAWRQNPPDSGKPLIEELRDDVARTVERLRRLADEH